MQVALQGKVKNNTDLSNMPDSPEKDTILRQQRQIKGLEKNQQTQAVQDKKASDDLRNQAIGIAGQAAEIQKQIDQQNQQRQAAAQKPLVGLQ